MKALITGITGQDGSYLAEFLLIGNNTVMSEIQDSSSGDSISVSNHSFSQSSPVAKSVEGGRRIKESPTAIDPNRTLVTVITVVFNGERYLKDTIQSVVGQTYKNLEYIIVDGGSTDATVDIIREYEDQIDYWISEPDAGIYDAMNKGVMLARGDIIGILNSDDYYEINAIDQVVNEFKQTEDAIIHGAMNYFHSNNFAFRKDSEHTSRENLKRMVELHPTMFVPARIYKDVGLYDLDFPSIADWDFVIRCHRHGIKYTYLDFVLTNFRLGGESSKTTVERAQEKCRLRKKYGLMWSGLHYFGDLIRLSGVLILDYVGLRNWYKKYKQIKQQASSK